MWAEAATDCGWWSAICECVCVSLKCYIKLFWSLSCISTCVSRLSAPRLFEWVFWLFMFLWESLLVCRRRSVFQQMLNTCVCMRRWIIYCFLAVNTYLFNTQSYVSVNLFGCVFGFSLDPWPFLYALRWTWQHFIFLLTQYCVYIYFPLEFMPVWGFMFHKHPSHFMEPMVKIKNLMFRSNFLVNI